MTRDELKSVEMRFYERNGEPWVKLVVVYQDGTMNTLCDTELDADTIRVNFEHAEHKEAN